MPLLARILPLLKSISIAPKADGYAGTLLVLMHPSFWLGKPLVCAPSCIKHLPMIPFLAEHILSSRAYSGGPIREQYLISRRANVECNSHKSFLHLIANNMALCSFGEHYTCDALRLLTSPTNFRFGCHNILLFPTAKQPRPTARSH